jgi:hypothetical protein
MAISLKPLVLEGAPLQHAPENELGVVYLFSHLANKWGLKIEKIRAGFPDCIATQNIGGSRKEIRIEFEFRSRNFHQHGHDPKGCDWIVCWEHNWREAPKGLKIFELRKEFGLGFNVWIMPVRGEYSEKLAKFNAFENWSVPTQSNPGDLVLFYHASPHRCIRDVFLVEERAENISAGWRAGKDHMAPIKRVMGLDRPIPWEALRDNQMLADSSFVRMQMQGRHKATEYWPWLYDLLITRNSAVKKRLEKYSPANLR